MKIYLHLLICLVFLVCNRVDSKRKTRLRNSALKNVELRSIKVPVNAKEYWLHVSSIGLSDRFLSDSSFFIVFYFF